VQTFRGVAKVRERLAVHKQAAQFLNETYKSVWVGKRLSDIFHIKNGLKQGDALSPLLFILALEYAIRRVHINQVGLK
jgi:hypothetical protein